MRRIKTRIKAPFGEIVIEGENPKEILEIIKSIPENFIEEVTSLISRKLTPPIKAQLEGIVEFTTEGPVITTRKKLTHYEAIGLILYSMEDNMATAAQISKLLESSGIKSMVPARLNEMTKRGLVFKPNPSKPDFKLTVQGKRWIEDEVLPKLRGQES
ncbi:hypothetical protein DRO19_04870 [Candidatus Bathyarchaeota archaeon]|nr:MAG: hypothetical protein DRO19_04870 [Candidatus Bathyarchaeota archaeon]